MECQRSSSVQMPVLDNEQIISQPAKSTGSRLQNTFYYYDPQKGTRCKLVNATATVAASSACGAIGMHLITSQLPQYTESGASLYDRAVSQMDRLLPGSSPYLGIALGAALGAGGAVWLIRSAYQDGLKPRTVAAVRSVMNGLIHQVESDYKALQHCKSTVQTKEKELSTRKEAMLAEKERNRVEAQAIYERKVQVYRNEIAGVTGELRGFLAGVFNLVEDPDRVPTYEEAISNTRRSGSYQLGEEVHRFFERKDFSFGAQQRLLKSLIPHLTERELKSVERILAKYPKYQPALWPITGPLEWEYIIIDCQRKRNQREMGELESKVREMLTQYNCFELDSDGKVKKVPVADFSEYLPE